jgi:hypothetical protein
MRGGMQPDGSGFGSLGKLTGTICVQGERMHITNSNMLIKPVGPALRPDADRKYP